VKASFLDHDIKKPEASAEGGDSIYIVTLTEVIDGNNAMRNFEDRTVIEVSGNIYHDYEDEDEKYGKKGVKVYAELMVQGVAVPKDSSTTDENGDYQLALPNPGEYIIRLEYKRVAATSSGPITQEHIFEPIHIQQSFFVDTTMVDFIDESYEYFVIRYGGACGRNIGTCQIDIIDRDKNNKIKANYVVQNGFV
jgi:hypothetical protein